MLIKIKLAYFLLFVIAVTQKARDQNQGSRLLVEQQQTQVSIYGIRWSLGNVYNLLQSQRNNQQFILLFNSDRQLNSNAYVIFGKSSHTCRGSQYSLDEFQTFQYSCIINQKPITQNYSIRTGNLDLTGKQDKYHIDSYNEIILYEGLLRFEALGQSIAMMGRVQAIQPINSSVLKILEDENVSVVAVSEIIPRVSSNNFKDILIYLQPITSRAFTIPISIDNFGKDAFWSSVLFPAYSRQREDIQAYVFSSVKIRVVCLGPHKLQQLITPLNQRLNNPSQQDYLTVMLSMYSLSENIQQASLNVLDLNIHLNLIQETDNYKQVKICNHIKDKGQQCIYEINEGYITSQRSELGIMQSKINKDNASYQWKHYQGTQQSKSTVLWQQASIQETHQQNQIGINISVFRRILIAALLITFLFLVSLILLYYIRYRKGLSSKNNQIHMQLVQQIVNGAQPPQLPVNL